MAVNIDQIIANAKASKTLSYSERDKNTFDNSKQVAYQAIEKAKLEKTIGADTFESDLRNLEAKVKGIYNSWQNPTMLNDTRSSIENMQKRIGAYQTYRQKYGNGAGVDLSELSKGYETVLGDWDSITEYFSGFENEESYNAMVQWLKNVEDNRSVNIANLEKEIAQLEIQLKPLQEEANSRRQANNIKHRDGGLALSRHNERYGYKYNPETGRTENANGKTAEEISSEAEEIKKLIEQKKSSFNQAKYAQNYIYLTENDVSLEDLAAHLKDDDPVAYTTSAGQSVTWKYLYAEEDLKTRYEEYSKRDDWEEKSKPDSSQGGIGGDSYYRRVNWKVAAEDDSFRPYNTEEERAIYNYLYATEGSKVANEWHKSREFLFEERKKERTQAFYEKLASKVPVISSILSVGLNSVSGLEWLGNVINGEADKTIYTSLGASTIRNTVMKKIDWEIAGWDAFDFVYSTGMSAADTLAATAFFAPLGKTSAVASKVASAASAATLSLSAAASATNAALDRGLSGSDAFWNGFFSGLFEGVFEYVSIGNLKALKTSLGDGSFKTFAKNLAKSMGINASEETLTELANIAYDTFINADFSQYETLVRQYVAQGMSQKEAESKAKGDLRNQIFEAMASGTLMGFGFGTYGGIKSNINAKAVLNTYDSDSINALIDEGLSAPGSDAYKLALQYRQKLNSGKSLNAQEIVDLVNANEKAFTESDRNKIIAAVAKRLAQLGEKNNISKLAKAITKTAIGQRTTLSEKNLVKKSKYGQLVANELNTENISSGNYSSSWAQNIGTERINAQAYNQQSVILDKNSAGNYNNIKGDEADVFTGGDMESGATVQTDGRGEANYYRSNGATSENVTRRASEDPQGVFQEKSIYLKQGDNNGVVNTGGLGPRSYEAQKASDTGRNIEGKRIRKEDEESFKRRYRETSRKALGGVPVFSVKGNSILAYVEGKQEDTSGYRATQILISAKVDAVYCNGDIEINRDGVTVSISNALTTRDGKVYVSSNANLSDTEIAAHEIVHVKQQLKSSEYVNFESVVCENLLWFSEKYKEQASVINESHYDQRYDIESPDFAEPFIAEITAYINGILAADPARAERNFAEMFEDWDAVVAASKQFNKDIGADFSESAISMPEGGKNRKRIEDYVEDFDDDADVFTEPPKKEIARERTREQKLEDMAGTYRSDRMLQIEETAKQLGVNLRWSNNVSRGLYNPKTRTIVLNPQLTLSQMYIEVFKHEFVHFLENKKGYSDFRDYLFKESPAFEAFCRDKTGNTAGSRDKVIDECARLYYQNWIVSDEMPLRQRESFTIDDARAEMVADFVGERLLGGKSSKSLELLQELAAHKPTIIERLREWIKSILSRLKGDPHFKTLEQDFSYLDKRLAAVYNSATKNTTDDSGVKYSVDPGFTKEYDKWDKVKTGFKFRIGTTSSALREIGVKNTNIYWDASKILTIKKVHPAMTDNVIKQVPNIIEFPILIMESRTVAGRLTLFGEVYDANGAPVLAILELNPTNKMGHALNIIKIASAYGKDTNPQKLIDNSKILYVDTNKNRTDSWLTANGLQLPRPSSSIDSTNSITHNGATVNNYSMQSGAGNSSDEDISHVFAGESSQSADKLKLKTAEKLEREGKDKEYIRRETGWHRGDDGKWRFEINDKDCRFKNVYVTGGTTLGHIFKHDALFKAYPELKNISVELERGISMGSADASYVPETNKILVSLELLTDEKTKAEIEKLKQTEEYRDFSTAKSFGLKEGLKIKNFWSTKVGQKYLLLTEKAYRGRIVDSVEAREAIIHEIQHAVQEIEEFSKGSNPFELMKAGYSTKESFKKYKNSAGEREADDSVARLLYDDAKRAETPPDVGREGVVFAEDLLKKLEPSAKAPAYNMMENFMYESNGLTRYSEDQKLIRRIGKSLGWTIEFSDVRTKNGAKADGRIDRKRRIITISTYNEQPIRFILKHELTHFGESSKYYSSFVKAVRRSDVYKEWLSARTGMSDDVDSMETEAINQIIDNRKGKEDLTPDSALYELIANFAGDNLFGGSDAMQQILNGVTGKQRNAILQFIIDFFEHICEKLSGHSELTFELRRLQSGYIRLLNDAKASQPAVYSSPSRGFAQAKLNEKAMEDMYGKEGYRPERNTSDTDMGRPTDQYSVARPTGVSDGAETGTDGSWRMERRVVNGAELEVVAEESYTEEMRSLAEQNRQNGYETFYTVSNEPSSVKGNTVIIPIDAVSQDIYSFDRGVASFTELRLKSLFDNNISGGDMVAYISPADFLKLTSSEANMQNIRSETGVLRPDDLRGEQETPFLTVNAQTGEVVGHEGRHRMSALQNSGIEKVAFVIKAAEGTSFGNRAASNLQLTGQQFAMSHADATVMLEEALPLTEQYRSEIEAKFLNNDADISYSFANESVKAEVVDLSDDSELVSRIEGLRGAQKYTVIQNYILEVLHDQPIRLSDGKEAIVDKHDAMHLARKAGDKKAKQIAEIKKIIETAKLVANENSTKERKFDYFYYYEAKVKYRQETYPIYLNVGRARNDGTYHIYDITQKLRDTAHRVNDVGRPVGNALESSVSINSIYDSAHKINNFDKNPKHSIALKDSKETISKNSDRLAGKIIRQNRSRADQTFVSEQIQTIIESVADNKWGPAMSAALRAADAIVDSSRFSEQLSEDAVELLNEIRNTPVSLNSKQKAEVAYIYGSYNDYRKQNMGRLNLKNGATPLDIKWQEWSEAYPHLFDEGLSDADVLAALANIVESLRSQFETYDTESARQFVAEQIFTEAVNTGGKPQSAIDEAIFQLQEKHNAEIAGLKRRVSQAERRVAFQDKLIESGHNELARAELEGRRDRRDRTKNIEYIRRKVSRIDKKLRKNSTKNPVPEKLCAAVKSFCGAFLENDNSVFDYKQMNRIYNMYSANKGAVEVDGDALLGTYDHDVAKDLKELVEIMDGHTLRQLDLPVLQKVRNIVDNLEHMITNEHKLFINGRAEDMREIGDSILKELKEEKSSRSSILVKGAVRDFAIKNMTPIYFADMIGPTFKEKLYNPMRDAQDKAENNLEKGAAFIRQTQEKYHYSEWGDDTFKFTTSHGDQIELTREQAMLLYATDKRERANKEKEPRHLASGVTLPQDLSIKKAVKDLGKLSQKRKQDIDSQEKNNAVHQVKDEVIKTLFKKADTKAHRIKPIDVGLVNQWLTDEQKAYVDAMVKYLSIDMAALGNEVTMQLFGICKYGEDYYIPYNSARNYLRSQPGISSVDTRLKNQSFTHDTEYNANTPLVLSNFTEVCADHIQKMVVYNAFTVPIENLNRIFNYGYAADDKGSDALSVKAEIERAFGKGAVDYLEKFIEDVNGYGKSFDDTFMGKMTGLMKKGAVALSASVAIQQPSAIVRATALIDTKYFAKSVFTKSDYEEFWEIPIVRIKARGRFDTGVGTNTAKWMLREEYFGVKEKSKAFFTDKEFRDDAFSFFASKLDEITWMRIWAAVKAETADKTDFAPGSEEFRQYAETRFRDVIDYTQVYDSVLSRSHLMRDQNPFVKTATAFMSESTVSNNLLLAGIRKGHTKGNRKILVRHLSAWLGSKIFNAMLYALVAAARDDDEYETYAEKYFEQFSGKVEEGVLIFNDIPYAKDIISVVNGWALERPEMALFVDLINAAQGLSSGEKSKEEKALDLAKGVAAFFGLPLKNALRDTEALFNVVDEIINGPSAGSQYMDALEQSDTYKSLNSEEKKKVASNLKSSIKKEKEVKSVSYDVELYDRLFLMKLRGSENYSKMKKKLIAEGVSENTIKDRLEIAKIAFLKERGVDVHEYILSKLMTSEAKADLDSSGSVSVKEKKIAINKMDLSQSEKSALISVLS